MVNVKNIADEADMIINERYEIDELADAAGGFCDAVSGRTCLHRTFV